MLIIVMGVAGAGKTTVGEQLAASYGMEFHDADHFHSAAAVEKMAAGQPLDDADRGPWIGRLAQLIGEAAAANRPLVLAASMLKEQYRAVLRDSAAARGRPLWFVYLKVSRATAAHRVRQRQDHFMPPSLIDSQFEALEEPREAIVIDADQSIETVMSELADWLHGS